MRSIPLLFLLVSSCILSVIDASTQPGGKRILAVVNGLDIKSSHSIFFKSLEERGYQVEYRVASEKNIPLRRYGEWQYDQLIIFASSWSLTTQTVLDFIDQGHNVLLATDSHVNQQIRDIASECSVEFDEKDSHVIDHLNYDGSDFDGSHSLIVASEITRIPGVFEKIDSPILFRGVGQDIIEDSQLVFSLLTASTTSYSHHPHETVDELHVAGKKTVLVSALQARNNARAIFSGSIELFSDKFFRSDVTRYGDTKKSASGNEQFAKQVSQWVFQERGILRARDIKHHRIGETEAPATYTIKDQIEFSAVIEEFNGNTWVPFHGKDIQVEFTRIDPFVRTKMIPDGKGNFVAKFQIPDVYGVFTFKIDYIRKGYGFLSVIERTPVRPFRHNEYERFIVSAYPYYASAFSMIGGLFIFSFVFLYHREK